MRTVAIVLAAASSNALATPLFEGTWVTCLPTPAEGQPTYAVVEVQRDRGDYTVVQEWGQNYATSGPAYIERTTLVARGCSTFRGEVMAQCDEKAPPVFFTLSAAQAAGKPNSSVALRRYQPVRVAGSLKALTEQCERLAHKRRASQASGVQ